MTRGTKVDKLVLGMLGDGPTTWVIQKPVPPGPFLPAPPAPPPPPHPPAFYR